MVGEMHLCSQAKHVTGLPRLSAPRLGERQAPGEWAGGSPLRRAVGLNKAHERWGGQGLGGEDAALELQAEAAEGVSAEHDLRGLRVHNLAARPHRAGGQRHCGAGGQALRAACRGASCQSPPTLGGTTWSGRGPVSWRPDRPGAGPSRGPF